MKKYLTCILISTSLVVSILALPLLGIAKIFELHPELAEHAYEELLLTIVSDKIVKGKDKKNIIKNACSFMEQEMYSDILFYLPSRFLYTLTTGNALCNSSARLMGELLQRNGIPTRLNVSVKHVTLEALYNNKWILLEPTGGIAYVDRKDEFLTTEEFIKLFSTDYDLLEKNLGDQVIANSDVENIKELIDHIKKSYSPIKYIEISAYYPECANKDPSIYLYINNFFKYGYKYYGSLWIKISQNEYFKYLNKNISKLEDWAYIYKKKEQKVQGEYISISKIFNSEDYPEVFSSKESFLLFKARNYHIAGFFNSEENIYKDILSRKTSFSYQAFALFYYGKLLYKKGNFNKSIEIFEKFIKFNKNIRINNKIAYYFLGLCYEAKGNKKQAINNYFMATRNTIRGFRSYSEFEFKRASKKLYSLKATAPSFIKNFE